MNKRPENEHKSNKKVVEATNYTPHPLPDDLNEISGISFVSDNLVAAIEDEDGVLYYVDLTKDQIVKTLQFGPPDDYEDLAQVGKDMYVIVSNGLLYQLKNFRSGKPEIKTYKTVLTGKNNIEGMAYDSHNNRLLLSAKDVGLSKDDASKEIYAFDLKTMQLQPEPAFRVQLSEIESYFKGDALEESSKKLLKAFGNENMNKVIRPSALTVHPLTQEIYLLSSINNLVVVLSADGKINRLLSFDSKDFKQPEGIAFNRAGKLFISNEGGKSGIGNIIEVGYAN